MKGKGKGKGKKQTEGDDGTFTPHMTLAKSRDGDKQAHSNLSRSWAACVQLQGASCKRRRQEDINRSTLVEALAGKEAVDIRFQVDHVSICERGDETPFREVATLWLSKDSARGSGN